MSEQRQVTVRVRRSPRFGVFLVLGGLAGIVAALIAITAGGAVAGYSVFTSFTYFAAVFIIGGILLGALAALLTERILRRRSTDVAVTGSFAPMETETPATEAPVTETPDAETPDAGGEGDDHHTSMGH